MNETLEIQCLGLIGEMGLLAEWVGRSARWVGAGDGSKLGWV